MRKFLLLTTLAAVAVVAAGIAAEAQTYGPGMMGNDQDYGNHRGYGPGYGRMGGGNGPDMMGYGSADGRNGRGAGYRGKHVCWTETDSSRGYGYYAQCAN